MIGSHRRVAVTLKQNEPGEVVCLAFKKIGDLGIQSLFAIVKQSEGAAMSREFVVPRLMQLQEVLFGFVNAIIDVVNVAPAS